MNKGFKKLVLMVLAFAMTVSLCACAGGKDTSSADTIEAPERAATNEINVAIPQDLDDSLDPHMSVAAGTREVNFNIFEGLLKVAPDGNIVPAVAEKWEVSPDGTAYSFTIREGVKFHNGDIVTADDVVFSISRCAGMLDDNYYSASGTLECVESVKKTDDRTVLITLNAPNAEFVSYLATTNAAIIPDDYADQATAPVGTGPFKFVSRSPQENFIMERFDDYWGEKAKLQKVNYLIIEAGSWVMSLKSGAIDVVAHMTIDQVKSVEDMYVIEKDTMKLVQAMYLNHNFEPFTDVRVRQALCYAVDKQAVTDFVLDGYGVPIGSSMFPAFGRYFMPELTDYYTLDIEKAKALLAEAGYPNGFEFTLTVPSNYPQHVQTGEVIAEMLKAIGVTAHIQQVEWTTWTGDVYANRNFEATIVGFDASTLTASALLQRWVSDYGKNMINFNNAEYDELYAQAAVCADMDEQTELFKRMLTILTEEAANVYIQDMYDMVAVNPYLDGLQFYPMYVLDLTTLEWTETSKK